MFENLLKWVFKNGEKEIHVLMSHDTSLEVLKNLANAILKYVAIMEHNQEQEKQNSENDCDKKDEAGDEKPEEHEVVHVEC